MKCLVQFDGGDTGLDLPCLPEFPRLGYLDDGSFFLVGGSFHCGIEVDVDDLAKAIAQHPKTGAILTDAFDWTCFCFLRGVSPLEYMTYQDCIET